MRYSIKEFQNEHLVICKILEDLKEALNSSSEGEALNIGISFFKEHYPILAEHLRKEELLCNWMDDNLDESSKVDVLIQSKEILDDEVQNLKKKVILQSFTRINMRDVLLDTISKTEERIAIEENIVFSTASSWCEMGFFEA